jgi:hypothetical protein
MAELETESLSLSGPAVLGLSGPATSRHSSSVTTGLAGCGYIGTAPYHTERSRGPQIPPCTDCQEQSGAENARQEETLEWARKSVVAVLTE